METGKLIMKVSVFFWIFSESIEFSKKFYENILIGNFTTNYFVYMQFCCNFNHCRDISKNV